MAEKETRVRGVRFSLGGGGYERFYDMAEKGINRRLRGCMNEAERRLREDRLKYYRPSPKQEIFHRCLKRNRWLFGGNRSGKTECGAAETVMLALGAHPYRENRREVSCWAVSLSRQVQRDVAQKKILYYLNPRRIREIRMLSGRAAGAENGVIDFIVVENAFGNLSRIGFKSCDQGREKFQGASLDFVWFDEEPPEDIYRECRVRTLDRGGEVFGTMTPLKGTTYIYNEVFLNQGGDPETWHASMEWADNPHLDSGEITRLSGLMSAEELQARRYGKFVNSRGLVYPEFDESVNVIPPFNVPLEWYDTLSIDPGLNNPLSCHWYAVSPDGCVYVIAEHYEAGKDAGYHSRAIKAVCEGLNWHADSAGRVEALIDAAATQRTLAADKSVCELFFEYGIKANPRVNKDLFTGINRVKGYLKNADGKPKLFIFNTCVNLIRELKGYWWGGGDVPRKKDDHALDELRYYLMSRPEFDAPKREAGEIEKDKERLIKKMKYK